MNNNFITLYRPVGKAEMQLIADNNYCAYPPRLEWQPIFYPVLNQRYAEEIAEKWNTTDEFSGYSGYVTAFDIATDYIEQFETQNVGAKNHNELWVPAEQLAEFNEQIIGKIRVVNAFFGQDFDRFKHDELTEYYHQFNSKKNEY